jgi:hypothetical protein
MNTTMPIVCHNGHISNNSAHIVDAEAKFRDDLDELVVSVVLNVVE